MKMTNSEKKLLAGTICGPHCDARILHAPGDCETCDAFPLLQKAREIWGITFTEQPVSEKQPLECPAVLARGVDSLNSWGGNVQTKTNKRREAVLATREKNAAL